MIRNKMPDSRFKLFFLLALVSFVCSSVRADSTNQDALGGMTVNNASQSAGPVKDQVAQQADMGWWRAAKFGMFIHWGVYSVPASGEWFMNQKKVPVAKYKEYATRFDPEKYDPEAWVEMAKDAGMKYIVITAKHHDGFAMFDSKASDWNIVDATPYKKDVLKPLADACRKNGIKLGFYYSQAQDWVNGGSAIGGKWDLAQQRDMNDYIEKIAVPQVRELLTNYGEGTPAILWWDTPKDISDAQAQKILDVIKELNPTAIQNCRLESNKPGNYQTPEQYVPVVGIKGDWETCMTMNGSWGYASSDKNWKSPASLIQSLANVCSKGGNLLLNVGPTSEGELPPASIERLRVIGQWMRINGNSIYGTTAGPFPYLSWGCATRKSNVLYLHVFHWPQDGSLRVPLLSNAKAAWLLAAPSQKLEIGRAGNGLTIKVPITVPDQSDSVVALQLDGEPQVEPLPTVGATATASAAQPQNGPENILDGAIGKRWMAPMDTNSAYVQIDLGHEQKIGGYGFDEPDVWPRMKQSFTLEALVGKTWQNVAAGKTEGHGSVGTFPAVTAEEFRLTMNCDKGGPSVAAFQLYRPE